MASGNIDLIRPIYDEWGRGNWRTNFDVYDPEMEWGWSSEFLGLGGVCKDQRDPNPRLRAWLKGWEFWRAEANEFHEVGDYVVVLATYHGRGKESGVDIEQLGAHVFEVRDDKVVRLEIFATRERAIAWVQAAVAASPGQPRAARSG